MAFSPGAGPGKEYSFVCMAPCPSQHALLGPAGQRGAWILDTVNLQFDKPPTAALCSGEIGHPLPGEQHFHA